jgi:hypothetical protein
VWEPADTGGSTEYVEGSIGGNNGPSIFPDGRDTNGTDTSGNGHYFQTPGGNQLQGNKRFINQLPRKQEIHQPVTKETRDASTSFQGKKKCIDQLPRKQEMHRPDTKETRDASTRYQGNKRCIDQIPATMLRLSGLSLPF